jgi:transposase
VLVRWLTSDWAKQHLNLIIKPVNRPKNASGFVVLPRRWVVERSLAWMMHAAGMPGTTNGSSSTPKL